MVVGVGSGGRQSVVVYVCGWVYCPAICNRNDCQAFLDMYDQTPVPYQCHSVKPCGVLGSNYGSLISCFPHPPKRNRRKRREAQQGKDKGKSRVVYIVQLINKAYIASRSTKKSATLGKGNSPENSNQVVDSEDEGDSEAAKAPSTRKVSHNPTQTGIVSRGNQAA